jgi:hypothetical protein
LSSCDGHWLNGQFHCHVNHAKLSVTRLDFRSPWKLRCRKRIDVERRSIWSYRQDVSIMTVTSVELLILRLIGGLLASAAGRVALSLRERSTARTVGCIAACVLVAALSGGCAKKEGAPEYPDEASPAAAESPPEYPQAAPSEESPPEDSQAAASESPSVQQPAAGPPVRARNPEARPPSEAIPREIGSGNPPLASLSVSALPPFPWPPPKPSALLVIPSEVLLKGDGSPEARLGDVNRALRRALHHGGYWEIAYHSVPRGFVLVARLERINEDGSSFADMARWDQSIRNLELRRFSVGAYLRALLYAPRGYYRVIAFVVSPTPFSATGPQISAAEANIWLYSGANALPREIEDQAYSPDYACTALIYEFEKQDTGSDAVERHPGRLSASTHLAKSKIAEALQWSL